VKETMMRPMPWQPPVDLSPPEQAVARRVRRAKLFVFLRTHRHTLFDAAFQEELATLYADRPKGHPPVPPALLALATILQAYTGASDAEAVEATVMDRRWQLALDCLDCTDAPLSVGTLVSFRERLIATDLDRRLVERTVEVAARTKGFGHTTLRAALDSSPLWGRGESKARITCWDTRCARQWACWRASRGGSWRTWRRRRARRSWPGRA